MNKRNTLFTLIFAITITVSAAAFGGMHVARIQRSTVPPASEFGPGPRASAKGLYIVHLQGAKELKARKMYTLQAVVAGADAQPVSNATIAVGGGMPQHGHGLPTRPRVTKDLGNGWYEVSGVRFNMGGWWELKLTITTPAGTDTVTFNLKV